MSAELAFSVGDLARVRFAVSPMWEVGPSLRLLCSGRARAHAVHRRWAEEVGPRLVAARLDRGWLAELVPPAYYVPDFLNPAPPPPPPPSRRSSPGSGPFRPRAYAGTSTGCAASRSGRAPGQRPCTRTRKA